MRTRIVRLGKDCRSFLRRHELLLIAALGLMAFVCLFLAKAGVSFGGLVERFPWLSSVSSAYSKAVVLLYSYAQLLVFNLAPEELPKGFLWTSAYLCALMMVAAAVYSLLRRAWARVRLVAWMRFRRRFAVVCGMGRLGRQLVRDLTGPDSPIQRVVVIESDAANPALIAVREMGALVVLGDATDEVTLDKAGISDASEIYLVTGSDETNVNVGISVGQRRARCGAPHPSEERFRCFMHLDKYCCIDAYRTMLATAGLDENLVCFSIVEHTAQALVRKHLATAMPQDDEVMHYFLFGFGDYGQAIAIQIACQAHFRNAKRVRMTICDEPEALEKNREAFLGRNPAFCPENLDLGNIPAEAARLDRWDCNVLRPAAEARAALETAPAGVHPVEYVCNAEFMEMPCDVDRDSFVALLQRRLDTPGVVPVFICCHDTDEQWNLYTAACLHNRLRDRQKNGPDRLSIHALLPRTTTFGEILERSPGNRRPPIVPFGQPSENCTRAMIQRPVWNHLAEVIYNAYRKITCNEDGGTQWAALSYLQKEENRHPAEHFLVKLRALGCEVRDVSPKQVVRLPDGFDAKRGLLEEMEHNRWMAYSLLIPKKKYGPEREGIYRPSLVVWSELSGKDREIDEQMVKAIPEMLSAWNAEIAGSFNGGKGVVKAGPAWYDACVREGGRLWRACQPGRR